MSANKTIKKPPAGPEVSDLPRQTELELFFETFLGFKVPDFRLRVYDNNRIVQIIVECLSSGIKNKNPHYHVFYMRFVLYRLRLELSETLSTYKIKELNPVLIWAKKQINYLEEIIRDQQIALPESRNEGCIFPLSDSLAHIFEPVGKVERYGQWKQLEFVTKMIIFYDVINDTPFINGLLTIVNSTFRTRIDKRVNHCLTFIIIEKFFQYGFIENKEYHSEKDIKRKEKIVREFICRKFKHNGKIIQPREISTEVSRYRNEKIRLPNHIERSKYDDFSAKLDQVFRIK